MGQGGGFPGLVYGEPYIRCDKMARFSLASFRLDDASPFHSQGRASRVRGQLGRNLARAGSLGR